MTHTPPNNRFCDLVMKGGIASGVVYPQAIAKLSHHYYFQSIGGTSAGAIAAAVTAAAEYQRRQTGSNAGFTLLAELPRRLGETTPSGTSKLLSLFQPQPPLRRLFRVLIGALNKTHTSSRIGAILVGFLKSYWPMTLGATVFAVLIGALGFGWLAACLTLLLAIPILVGWCVYQDITKKMVAHDLGLCTGLTVGGGDEALTPWLHTLIQTAAGRSATDAPLTFGDLWSAQTFPEPGQDRDLSRTIDLQMFSTNLSHGRPYIFPLQNEEYLYFTEDDMNRCLPSTVVKWMISKSPSTFPHQTNLNHREMRELPPPTDFPIVLAARMSLSFPFLFTAVPLYAMDSDTSQTKTLRRCWFSDGGISSNFPIHLFDDLVPTWPTFGLTLEPKLAGQSDVSLPTTYRQGYEERWNPAPDRQDASTLGWFISAIVGTMQNWNDNSLTRMPGVRDRVARVRLEKHEGGMNLNMEDTHIHAVAARGEAAIAEILNRFVPSHADGGCADGWDEHRFVRLHVLLKMLIARSPGITNALNPNCHHATDFADLFAKMKDAKDSSGDPLPPPGYDRPLTEQQCAHLNTFVRRLVELAQELQPLAQQIPFTAVPNPELRVRPPL